MTLSATATDVRRALPIALAVGAYGVTYGALAVAAGLAPGLVVASSVIVFAGASQFALVAVLPGGDPIAGVLGGLLLNLRYLVFGYAVAPRLPRGPAAGRLLDGYLLIDESAALALDGPAPGARRRLRVTGAVVWCCWVGATVLGALGGDLIGDVRRLGLDAALPAAFVALLAPGLRTPTGRWVAVLGAAAALLAVPWLPAGLPTLVAAAAVLPFVRRSPAGPDAR